MTDFSSRLTAASRAAPNLDPAILYGISKTSADDDSAVETAEATAGFGSALKLKRYMQDQDAHVQRAAWSAMPDAQRRLLRGAGYELPEPPKQGGLVSRVGHALSALAKGTGKAVGYALYPFAAAGRAVQHGVRTMYEVGQEQNRIAETTGRFPRALALDPSEWARAWRETEKGEQYFDPAQLREVTRRYGEEKVALARQLASVESREQALMPERIARTLPESERAAFLRRVHDDKELPEVIRLLETAKVTPGRQLALSLGLQDNPSVFGKVSGAIDAFYDFTLDPTLLGGKVVKSLRIARYAVRGPQDVERIARTSAGARYLDDVAKHINDGRVGELVERYPKLAHVAETFVKEKLDTGEKLKDWFKGQAGLAAILDGRVSGFHSPVPTLPVLTRPGQVRLAAKGGLKDVIDFAADIPARLAKSADPEDIANLPLYVRAPAKIVAGGGQLARKLTTLVPKGLEFDPTDARSLVHIQRLASYSLPATAARTVVDAWAAAPTLGAKKQIYKSLLGDVFRAAGLDSTPEARNWADRFLALLDENLTQRAYAVDGIDRMVVNGRQAAVGVLEGQLTESWALPSFRALWANSKRASITRSVIGTINQDIVDKFMESAWKPYVLLRLGFPIRAGGEELVGAILREGVRPILKSRLATSATTIEPTFASRGLGFLVDHLPKSVQAALTPATLAGHVMGHATHRAFKKVAGKLAGAEYVKAAEEIWHLYPEAFTEKISAVHNRAAGYLDTGPTAYRSTVNGTKIRPAQLVPTGAYRRYAQTEQHFVDVWKDSLDELSHDRLGRKAAEALDLPRDQAVRKVADYIESAAFSDARTKAMRMSQLRDGRKVGVDATAREAAEDWANVVLDHADSLLRDPEGNLLTDILQGARDGKVPRKTLLEQIPEELRPMAVKGPEVLPVTSSWLREATDTGFRELVGRPIDWMVRQPLFIHNYALAKKEAEGLAALFGDDAEGLVQHHIEQVALQRAIGKTASAIDDSQLKSQFSHVTRNLAPFWFAQEQFYKRWATTFVHSPEAFRKAQLTMSGLRHTGVVHTDENGEDWFWYPGVGAVQNLLVGVAEKVTGHKITLPVKTGFSGRVKYATPGLDGFLPSVGPLVGMPLSALARRFPELADLEQGVIGERGAGRPYWEQIMPTTLTRLIHAATDSPETSPQMASAMMQAIQYLEATGNGLRDDATTVETEHYFERVQAWTRVLFFTRLVFGFSVPAAPEVQFDPDNLNEEFRGLLTALPIDEAVEEFLRRHPDATSYTVFQSETAAPTVLPITEDAMRFMDNHREFLASYPAAAAWFFPQPGPNDPTDLRAYREQLSLHLRTRKTPRQFYEDIKFAEAAAVYFPSRDRKDAALERAEGPRADQIRRSWSKWKDGFLASHPVFASELVQPDRELKRQESLGQLRAGVADPRNPVDTERMRVLIGSYDRFTAKMQALTGANGWSATNRRKQLRGSFKTWAESYVVGDPALQGVYDRLMRPEVDPDG